MVTISIHICHISNWRQSAVTASYKVWIDLENIQWPTEDQTMYTLYIMYICIYTWLINAVTRWTLLCWIMRLNTVFQSSVITFIHTQSNWLKLQANVAARFFQSGWTRLYICTPLLIHALPNLTPPKSMGRVGEGSPN